MTLTIGQNPGLVRFEKGGRKIEITDGNGRNDGDVWLFSLVSRGIARKASGVLDGEHTKGLILPPRAFERVLDHGTGTGAQAAALSLDEKVKYIAAHDLFPAPLKHVQEMLRKNKIPQDYDLLLGDEGINWLEGISLGVSNMPQNPLGKIDCGEGGSKLQISAIMQAYNALVPGGILIVKSVSYAQLITEFPELSEKFDIHFIGKEDCINPNTGSLATVNYYLLQKKG